jgi:flavin-dependent dehydrogenase
VKTHYDIAIAGAGPAGAAAAHWLVQAGCSVVLLERSRFDRPRIGESLAPSVQPMLVELGVWQDFLNLNPLPSYGTRSAWGAALAEDQSHLLNPYLCGWHVDRLAFDRTIAESAVRRGAHLELGTQVVRYTAEANGGAVLSFSRVDDPDRVDQLRADFVIDATGRNSTVARKLGAASIMFDRLVAVAAQFDNARADTNRYTLVETTSDGWWYSAPAGVGSSVAVLMTDGDLLNAQHTKDPAEWQNALSRAVLTRATVDGCELKWGPSAFSAVSQRLRRAPGDRRRWLAVGDAALAVDPVSGSGILRALRTAKAAASAVLSTFAGDETAIPCYESDRDDECTSYLVKRAGYYRLEQRWPNAPFWQRRLAAFARLAEMEPALAS